MGLRRLWYSRIRCRRRPVGCLRDSLRRVRVSSKTSTPIEWPTFSIDDASRASGLAPFSNQCHIGRQFAALPVSLAPLSCVPGR
ncbi:hypothetical protein EJ06DRAFT_401277 [Trichodelitschia bisporula]|uniref:Uncharacterized protein n=1 Tax=Trichodelitschia bisporula TaxID=703511 RepID=A0A6G1HXI0_9PEZI|nr:hypothetical protein EJ06DRAFT_401277 [Trichodelitschia bisporula]